MLNAYPSRRILALSALALAVLLYSLYSPALKNDFVNWDDDIHLVKNTFIRPLNPNTVVNIFTTTVNTIYIPLTELSFAVEYHFFNDQPFIYHWINVVLHILVAIMLMFLALRLGVGCSGAFLAGLIFGIHPIHVESVAWVTERKDLLYSFFYMSALLGYCEYLKGLGKNERRRIYWLLMVFVSGFLSVLAKPMALSLPVVLCVLDWYFKRPLNFRAIIEKVLLGCLFLPVIWVTYSQHQHIPQLKFPESIFMGIWHYSIYLRNFFWPSQFFLSYSIPSPLDLNNLNILAATVILCGLMVVFFVVKWRFFNFAVLFYTASIFFLVRLDQGGDGGYTSDRFMYLASAGFCVAIGAGAEYLWNAREMISKLGCAIVLVGGIIVLVSKTTAQILVWRDGVALWEHQLKARPVMAPLLIYLKLGQAYVQRFLSTSDPEYLIKAENAFKKAIKIKPNDVNVQSSLQEVYSLMRP